MNGIAKLVARFPGEPQTWPMTYDPPMLTLDEIGNAEQVIELEIEMLGFELVSPYNNKPYRHVKHVACTATIPKEEKALQFYERISADFYNGISSYGDTKGFVIQIIKPVPEYEAEQKLADDQARWKSRRKGTVSIDPALIGTVYVETDLSKLHPSMRTGDDREKWAYIDVICAAPEHHKLGIGSKLMQLALLGAMRRGCQHVVLDSVKTAINKYRDWGFEPWTTVAKKSGRMTLMWAKWIMNVWNRLEQLTLYYSNPKRRPRHDPVTGEAEFTEYEEFSDSNDEDAGYNSEEHVEAIFGRYNDQIGRNVTNADVEEYYRFNLALTKHGQPRIPTFFAWDQARQNYQGFRRFADELKVEPPSFLDWAIQGMDSGREMFNRVLAEHQRDPLTVKQWDKARRDYPEVQRIAQENEGEIPSFLEWVLSGMKKSSGRTRGKGKNRARTTRKRKKKTTSKTKTKRRRS